MVDPRDTVRRDGWEVEGEMPRSVTMLGLVLMVLVFAALAALQGWAIWAFFRVCSHG